MTPRIKARRERRERNKRLRAAALTGSNLPTQADGSSLKPGPAREIFFRAIGLARAGAKASGGGYYGGTPTLDTLHDHARTAASVVTGSPRLPDGNLPKAIRAALEVAAVRSSSLDHGWRPAAPPREATTDGERWARRVLHAEIGEFTGEIRSRFSRTSPVLYVAPGFEGKRPKVPPTFCPDVRLPLSSVTRLWLEGWCGRRIDFGEHVGIPVALIDRTQTGDRRDVWMLKVLTRMEHRQEQRTVVVVRGVVRRLPSGRVVPGRIDPPDTLALLDLVSPEEG